MTRLGAMKWEDEEKQGFRRFVLRRGLYETAPGLFIVEFLRAAFGDGVTLRGIFLLTLPLSIILGLLVGVLFWHYGRWDYRRFVLKAQAENAPLAEKS
jgi:hypothetical protein